MSKKISERTAAHLIADAIGRLGDFPRYPDGVQVNSIAATVNGNQLVVTFRINTGDQVMTFNSVDPRVESDLKNPLTMRVETDHTNVRMIITITGASGRSYTNDYLDRDELQAFDQEDWAWKQAKWAAERIRKQGREVVLEGE